MRSHQKRTQSQSCWNAFSVGESSSGSPCDPLEWPWSVTVRGAHNWSRRYKANLEKLASGDLVQVAEVVRDILAREASRRLSAGEKRILTKARTILLQEGYPEPAR